MLYLIFNEGHTATARPDLQRGELTAKAIRLTRAAHRLPPLMLLTEARRRARTGPGGMLVPLPEQDRGRWDRAAAAEGTALVTGAMTGSPLGPYQLPAAHRRRPRRDPAHRPAADPRAVRAAGAPLGQPGDHAQPRGGRGDGARPRGRTCWRHWMPTPRAVRHHRLSAVRAHLLEMAGDTGAVEAGPPASLGGTWGPGAARLTRR